MVQAICARLWYGLLNIMPFYNGHPAVSFSVKLHGNHYNDFSWNVWSTRTRTNTKYSLMLFCFRGVFFLFHFSFIRLSRSHGCSVLSFARSSVLSQQPHSFKTHTHACMPILSQAKHVFRLLKRCLGSHSMQTVKCASNIEHTREAHEHAQIHFDISGFDNNFTSIFRLISNAIHALSHMLMSRSCTIFPILMINFP